MEIEWWRGVVGVWLEAVEVARRGRDEGGEPVTTTTRISCWSGGADLVSKVEMDEVAEILPHQRSKRWSWRGSELVGEVEIWARDGALAAVMVVIWGGFGGDLEAMVAVRTLESGGCGVQQRRWQVWSMLVASIVGGEDGDDGDESWDWRWQREVEWGAMGIGARVTKG